MSTLRKLLFAVVIVGVIATAATTVAQAWDCGRYNFRVTDSGSVQVQNLSGIYEVAQEADVYVNGSSVAKFNVPAMNGNVDWQEIGTISVPASSWNWKVVGTLDCRDEGSHKVKTPTPTVMPSKTPTNTVSPTASPTLTPSFTATFTATFTPSNTPTKKASSTATSNPAT